MLGSKRHANGILSDRPSVKLAKDDVLSVYESTLLKMQSKSLPQAVKQHFFTVGEAKGMTKQPYTAAGESVKPCFCKPERHVSLRGNAESNIVQNGAASSSVGSSSSRKTCISNGPLCFHCRRMTCSECWRHCMHCEENFCSVCSILDFNERYDRAFCLDCYSVVQRTNSK